MVTTKLKQESKAVYLTQLALFVKLLPEIKDDLIRMKEITNGLRLNASQLSDGESFRSSNASAISKTIPHFP